VIVLGGCATVQPSKEFGQAGALVIERTGVESVYDPGQPLLDDAERERILADGLTLDEALRVALLTNRRLQADFMSIGMAKADWVQAGLLSNPTSAFSVQFPEGGGRSNIQASLAQNIVDLWQIPRRKQVAEAALNETVLRVAHAATGLARDVQEDYFRAKAAESMLEIAQKNLDLVRRSHEAVRAQREAGTVTMLDENLALGQVLAAELTVRSARLERDQAKRTLVRRLSLEGAVDGLALADPLSEPPALTLEVEQMLALAHDSRLDLRAVNESVRSLQARWGLEKLDVFPEISVGPFLERSERRALPGRDVAADFVRSSLRRGALTAPEIQSPIERQRERSREIDAIFGPALTMTLPIFDQNQAQIAKARFQYLREIKSYEATLIELGQDIRGALDRSQTAQANAAFYRDELLPQAEKNLEFASASYTAGQTSILTVLEAQRSALTAHRGRIEAQLEAALAQAELERQLGTRLPAAAPSP
jgi:cobalt-zinc-cadmium efflux system outer membrane protein